MDDKMNIEQQETISKLRERFSKLSEENADDASFMSKIAKAYSGQRKSYSKLWKLGIPYQRVKNISLILNPRPDDIVPPSVNDDAFVDNGLIADGYIS